MGAAERLDPANVGVPPFICFLSNDVKSVTSLFVAAGGDALRRPVGAPVGP